jgi:hypothetical protein
MGLEKSALRGEAFPEPLAGEHLSAQGHKPYF